MPDPESLTRVGRGAHAAPPAGTASRPVRVLIALALIYAAVEFLALWRVQLFERALTFDDAYMFIRYAKHFLAGDGHAWNPGGDPTYGSTSLLHFFGVTGARALLPWSDGAVLRFCSSAAAGVGIATMAWTAARFSHSDALRGRWLACTAIVAPLLVSSYTFQENAFNGMDTMLALCANALLVLLALRAREQPTTVAGLLLAVAAELVFLARPDGAIYALGLPLLLLGWQGPGLRSPACTAFVAGFAGLLAVDTAAKTWVFGDPLPLSFYAKSAGFYQDYDGGYQWNPIVYLRLWVELLMPFLLVLCLGARRESWRFLACFALPVLATFAVLFQVMQIMGYRARFYVPALPLVIVPALLVLDQRLQTKPGETARDLRATLVPRLLAVVLLLSSGPAFARVEKLVERHVLGEPPAPFQFEWRAARRAPPLEWWASLEALASLAEQLPPGASMALSEYGYVGARAPRLELLDMIGLHSPEIARNGFSADALLDREPELISLPHSHYRGILEALLGSERLWREYDVYVGAFGFGLAVRRSGPRHARVAEIFDAEWRRWYGRLDPNATRALGPAFLERKTR